MVLENLAAAGIQGRDRARPSALHHAPAVAGPLHRCRRTVRRGRGRRAPGRDPDRPRVWHAVARPDLVAAAREAADARFDVLVACAFAYDAHASELTKLGPLPILQAKMNPDLHMADDLKTTGKGNLFVVFGEPDIEIRRLDGTGLKLR